MKQILHIIFIYILSFTYCQYSLLEHCKNYYGINDDNGGTAYLTSDISCAIIAPNKGISHEIEDTILPTLSKLIIPYNQYHGTLKTIYLGPSMNPIQPYIIVNISHNLFEGDLPTPVFHASQTTLKEIDFSFNLFTGNINSLFTNHVGKNPLEYVEYFNIRNNQFDGPIPDEIFNNMQFVKHLDLSNNKFTGCPKKVTVLDETNFFCDMRGNNFDEDCDFRNLNCLIDEKHFYKFNISNVVSTCPPNTICTIDDEITESLTIEGKLDISNEIIISSQLLTNNKPVLKTQKYGHVDIKNGKITVLVNDEIINDIKEGRMKSNINLIEGNNNGNFESLNIKHTESNKCIPLSSYINRDGNHGIFMILQPDEKKCQERSYLILYIFIGVLSVIVIIILSVMLALKFSQTFRDKVFPYNRRKNKSPEQV